MFALKVARQGKGLWFLKKDGKFSNYHKECTQVAIRMVRLGDIPCPSEGRTRNTRDIHITKEFCADKELVVQRKQDVIGIGFGSFGISTSVYLTHFQESATCAIVGLGNDTYKTLEK